MDTSWLNQMISMFCHDCKHEWVQPGKTGKCPKCHSANTFVIAERMNELKRV
jgi:Zn finger protein HypA/HybF involved in hydrogenase expression